MKLIVGLGNPGEKYEGTRHNLGFLTVDEYSRKKGLGEWKLNNGFKSELIESEFKIILAKPKTYMNNSGMAVSLLVNYFKILSEDLIVIHDDLDLHLGQIKIRFGGASAGHHGVESIIDKLGTDKFIRVRLGIGNWKTTSSEHGGNSMNVENFVLESFLSDEKHVVKQMIKKAIKAIDIVLKEGLEKAQNQFN